MRRFILAGFWVGAACLWVVWFRVAQAASADTVPHSSIVDTGAVSSPCESDAVPGVLAIPDTLKSQHGTDRGCINVNTAPESDLTRIKGIGPVLAGRIVGLRKARGPFKNPDDLLLVPGIGPVKMKKMQGQICF